MERGSLVQLEKTPHWVTLLLSPPAELQCVCKVSELGRRQKGNRNNFKVSEFIRRIKHTDRDIHTQLKTFTQMYKYTPTLICSCAGINTIYTAGVAREFANKEPGTKCNQYNQPVNQWTT